MTLASSLRCHNNVSLRAKDLALLIMQGSETRLLIIETRIEAFIHQNAYV